VAVPVRYLSGDLHATGNWIDGGQRRGGPQFDPAGTGAGKRSLFSP
jgi:hypothetical protein